MTLLMSNTGKVGKSLTIHGCCSRSRLHYNSKIRSYTHHIVHAVINFLSAGRVGCAAARGSENVGLDSAGIDNNGQESGGAKITNERHTDDFRFLFSDSSMTFIQHTVVPKRIRI